jgi:hypothetical protein
MVFRSGQDIDALLPALLSLTGTQASDREEPN